MTKKKTARVIRMSQEDWLARAVELFGRDAADWAFVCPSCGQVQSVRDFERFAGEGATPDSASQECIGRYDGHARSEMLSGDRPCNYVAYGLFNVCPVTVVLPDGRESPRFGFAIPSKKPEKA